MPELIYSEARGTWNVFVDNEWYFEGDYEQALEIYANCATYYIEDEEEM